VAAWLLVPFAARRHPVWFTRLLAVEHTALVIAVLSGFALMSAHGWRLAHPRWLALKVGLVVLLIVPLEGFHAFVCHVWTPRARRDRDALAPRRVERGEGMEEMIRTLGIPLLGTAVPILLWLSLRKPF